MPALRGPRAGPRRKWRGPPGRSPRVVRARLAPGGAPPIAPRWSGHAAPGPRLGAPEPEQSPPRCRWSRPLPAPCDRRDPSRSRVELRQNVAFDAAKLRIGQTPLVIVECRVTQRLVGRPFPRKTPVADADQGFLHHPAQLGGLEAIQPADGAVATGG